MANGEFGVVEATPSEPPSSTWICPSCHSARLPSGAEPGMIASAVVISAHVEPTVGARRVPVHGTVALDVLVLERALLEAGRARRCRLSVIRSGRRSWSWPV